MSNPHCTTDAEGRYSGDLVTHRDEQAPGAPLMRTTMSQGQPIPEAIASLEDTVEHAREAFKRLPEELQALESCNRAYPVTVSERLRQLRAECLSRSA